MAKPKAQYTLFRSMSKEEQREHILDVASLCIDGAGTSLARYIEIYLDVTTDEQTKRREAIIKREGWGP